MKIPPPAGGSRFGVYVYCSFASALPRSHRRVASGREHAVILVLVTRQGTKGHVNVWGRDELNSGWSLRNSRCIQSPARARTDCSLSEPPRRGMACVLSSDPPPVVANAHFSCRVGGERQEGGGCRRGMTDTAGLRAALGARIGAWGIREDLLAGLLRGGVSAAVETVLASDLVDVCVRWISGSCSGGSMRMGMTASWAC